MKQIIIGIDPGSRTTGYGLIASNGQQHRYIASGSIKTTHDHLSMKLCEIYTCVNELIRVHHPNMAAIEQVFMHKNANSALKLGQARGVAIVAIASHAIPLAEYAPREIKRAIVGTGSADKSQMQHMVKILLKLDQVPPHDAADALGIAICHAHSVRLR